MITLFHVDLPRKIIIIVEYLISFARNTHIVGMIP